MEGAPKPLIVKWANADKKDLIKSPVTPLFDSEAALKSCYAIIT